ncbi:hypothetical protein RQP46_003963 [Phenoliferia psychrophenolica]
MARARGRDEPEAAPPKAAPSSPLALPPQSPTPPTPSHSPPSPPSAPRSPISILSPELISHILTFTSPPSSSSSSSLRPSPRLSLVCRAWRDPAARLLWRRLVLRGSTNIQRLITSGNPGGYYVKEVELYGVGNQKDFEVLKLCEGVERLTIAAVVDVPTSVFSMPSLSALESLTLQCSALSPFYSPLPPSFRLSSLTLRGLIKPHVLLRPLLISSIPTLTHLTLASIPDSHIFLQIRELAPNLVSLSLDSLVVTNDIESHPTLPSPLSQFLNTATSLTHLTLNSSFSFSDDDDAASTAELDRVLAAVGHPLQSLSLGEGHVDEDHLAVLLEHVLMETLGRLDWIAWTYAGRSEVLDVPGGAYLLLQLDRNGTEVRFFEL